MLNDYFAHGQHLRRLRELGSRNPLPLTPDVGDSFRNSDENTTRTRVSHCSLCGHPGTKRSHLKDSCERCNSSTIKGCTQKPIGFTCDCSSCDMVRLRMTACSIHKRGNLVFSTFISFFFNKYVN